MATDHSDVIISLDDFDENNISYIKPILFYKVVRNMGVYYKSNIESVHKPKDEQNTTKTIKSSKKQKIIIQTPKMLVPFGIKEFNNNNKKVYKICLSFSTMTNLYNEDEIKKFFNFIKRIDSINEETILDYRKAWGLPKKMTYQKTLKRSSRDFPYFMNVDLPHDEKFGFLFNVYDENAIKSTLDIIEKKSVVSAVMELTDLKFTDTEFRSNWTILQIRKFKPYSPLRDFFMSGCFICDTDDPEDKVYDQLLERYRKKITTPLSSFLISQMNPYLMADPPRIGCHGTTSDFNYHSHPINNPSNQYLSYQHNPYIYGQHQQFPPCIPNTMRQLESPYQSEQISQTMSSNRKPSIQNNSMHCGYKPPTVDELINARNKLKKVTPNKDKIPVPPPMPNDTDTTATPIKRTRKKKTVKKKTKSKKSRND